MALRRLESFDHYATADLAAKGITVTGAPTIGSGNGRNSTNAITGTNTNIGFSFAPTTSGTTFICGFALNMSTLAITNTPNTHLVTLINSLTTIMSARVNDTTGTISVFRGTAQTGTLLGTSSAAVAAGTWTYLELKFVLNSSSSGTVTIYKDNSAILTLTGIQTTTSATSWDAVTIFGLGSNTCTWKVDDLYLADASSGAITTVMGDVRIEALLPSTGNGTNTDFTPSTGSDHGALVDESVPNTSDYNSSSTVGHKDTYNYPSLASIAGSVKGVQYCFYGANSDAGARTVRPIVRQSGTDTNAGAAAQSLTAASFTYKLFLDELNPATASAYSISEVNADEFGITIAS